jgi:hypothetical protein
MVLTWRGKSACSIGARRADRQVSTKVVANVAGRYDTTMKPRVYIETTIPSYLTAWPSRDLVRAAHQQITREWWALRGSYDLYSSRLVVPECQAGDPKAAADRLAAMAGIPLLEQTSETAALAEVLVRDVPLPEKAAADALHIATAAVHGVEYLNSSGVQISGGSYPAARQTASICARKVALARWVQFPRQQWRRGQS